MVLAFRMFIIVLGSRGVDDLWSFETCGGRRCHSVIDARSKTFYEACSMWSKILTIPFQEHSKALLMMFLLWYFFCRTVMTDNYIITIYYYINAYAYWFWSLLLVFQLSYVLCQHPTHTICDIGRTTLEDAFIQMVDASRRTHHLTRKMIRCAQLQ